MLVMVHQQIKWQTIILRNTKKQKSGLNGRKRNTRIFSPTGKFGLF